MALRQLPARLRQEWNHLEGAFWNWSRDDGPLMSAVKLSRPRANARCS